MPTVRLGSPSARRLGSVLHLKLDTRRSYFYSRILTSPVACLLTDFINASQLETWGQLALGNRCFRYHRWHILTLSRSPVPLFHSHPLIPLPSSHHPRQSQAAYAPHTLAIILGYTDYFFMTSRVSSLPKDIILRLHTVGLLSRSHSPTPGLNYFVLNYEVLTIT